MCVCVYGGIACGLKSRGATLSCPGATPKHISQGAIKNLITALNCSLSAFSLALSSLPFTSSPPPQTEDPSPFTKSPLLLLFSLSYALDSLAQTPAGAAESVSGSGF